jgi:hypothetical protein
MRVALFMFRQQLYKYQLRWEDFQFRKPLAAIHGRRRVPAGINKVKA